MGSDLSLPLCSLDCGCDGREFRIFENESTGRSIYQRKRKEEGEGEGEATEAPSTSVSPPLAALEEAPKKLSFSKGPSIQLDSQKILASANSWTSNSVGEAGSVLSMVPWSLCQNFEWDYQVLFNSPWFRLPPVSSALQDVQKNYPEIFEISDGKLETFSKSFKAEYRKKILKMFQCFSTPENHDVMILKSSELQKFLENRSLKAEQPWLLSRNNLCLIFSGSGTPLLSIDQFSLLVLLTDEKFIFDVKSAIGQLRLALIFKFYDKNSSGFLGKKGIQLLLADAMGVVVGPHTSREISEIQSSEGLTFKQFFALVAAHKIRGTGGLLRIKTFLFDSKNPEKNREKGGGDSRKNSKISKISKSFRNLSPKKTPKTPKGEEK